MDKLFTLNDREEKIIRYKKIMKQIPTNPMKEDRQKSYFGNGFQVFAFISSQSTSI
jgi:hypothetical protein